MKFKPDDMCITVTGGHADLYPENLGRIVTITGLNGVFDGDVMYEFISNFPLRHRDLGLSLTGTIYETNLRLVKGGGLKLTAPAKELTLQP